MFAKKDKSRPMTTKFADRRMTHQPNAFDKSMTIMNPLVQQSTNDIEEVYDRHASPAQTVNQIFGDHQRRTCARLSVPHERRRRERFVGTQNNMMFQTVHNLTNV